MQVQVQAADVRGLVVGLGEQGPASPQGPECLQVTQTDEAGIDDTVTKTQNTVTCPQDM